MSKFSPHHSGWPSLDQAPPPVKDTMRLIRDNLRRGNRMVRDLPHRSLPPIPQMVAFAADGVLEIAETMVRRVAADAEPSARLKAFPLPVGAYLQCDAAQADARRRLFVAMHYAVAKHLLRQFWDATTREGLFVCETKIDAAWQRVQPISADMAGDAMAQVAAVTLALLREGPIRKMPLAARATAWDHEPDLVVFATAGLATATTALARAGAPQGPEMLGLAGDVVRARIRSFETALAAADSQQQFRRLYTEFAPLLL